MFLIVFSLTPMTCRPFYPLRSLNGEPKKAESWRGGGRSYLPREGTRAMKLCDVLSDLRNVMHRKNGGSDLTMDAVQVFLLLLFGIKKGQ
jgi:hypothetical protein